VAARAPADALSRQCFSVVSISCVVFIPNESMIRMLPSMEDRSQTDRVSEGQNRTSGVTNGGGGKLGQLLPGAADKEAQSSLAKYNN